MGRSYSGSDLKQLELKKGSSITADMGLFFLKGSLEAGISYASGYPGAPTSNVMDLLGDAYLPILKKMGIYFESSTNEAAAATKLYISVNEKIRGFVNWKVVGTNVASDVLSHIASSGVKGGCVILIGEDEECISTTVQMKSQIYAKGFTIPVVDPISNPESYLRLSSLTYELSEVAGQPVMFLFRSLSSNMIGTTIVQKENKIPEFSMVNRKSNFNPDMSRVPIPPDTLLHAKEKLENRIPKVLKFIRKNKFNKFVKGSQTSEIGIITHGGVYNNLMAILIEMELANITGEVAFDLLTLNMTFPLDPEEVSSFISTKKTVLIVEQGHPNYVEQSIKTIAYDRNFSSKIYGKKTGDSKVKGYIPQTDALAYDNLFMPVSNFILDHVSYNGRTKIIKTHQQKFINNIELQTQEIVSNLLPRSPSFCTGCPERPVFSSLKFVEKELDTRFIRLIDVGCYTMAKLPPFQYSDSLTGMGSSLDIGMGMANMYDRPIVVVFGDGTLFHSGLRNIDNAVHNNLNQIYNEHSINPQKANILVFILLNYHTAMTGDQQNPLSLHPENPRNTTIGTNMKNEKIPRLNLEKLFKVHGAKWVKTIPSYEIGKLTKTIKKALTTSGLKIIISDGECMLEKQRTVNAINREKRAKKKRIVIPKVQVDPLICNGCWPCSQYVGCPSEGKIPTTNPLRKGSIRRMLPSCVGCGVCSEVTQKFSLCPSTYNVKVIENPSKIDRLVRGINNSMISLLKLF